MLTNLVPYVPPEGIGVSGTLRVAPHKADVQLFLAAVEVSGSHDIVADQAGR